MTENINLNNALPASQGFIVTGANSGDGIGWSVSNAGDINGDGMADMIIGSSKYADSAYVIYGSTSISTIDLSSLTSSQGFALYGTVTSPCSEAIGWSVSKAGDVNGDGYDDIIIGAPNYCEGTSSRWTTTGRAYVVFGHSGSFSNMNLDSLTSSQGFSITGNDGKAGTSVSGAGDFNGDGYDDLIIGEPYTSNYNDYAKSDDGVSYIIFGHSGSFSNINIYSNGLSSSQGIVIAGATDSYSGYSVSGAGDVNGDGYDDVIIGGPGYTYAPTSSPLPTAGISYIIYGGTSTSSINLNSFSSSQGFSVTGAVAGDRSGSSVSGVGDINQDGYDDILIGAPYKKTSSYSSQTGSVTYKDAGTSYLVFGAPTASLSNINLADTQSNWVYMESRKVEGRSGFSVSGAGDVNGDGYPDLIIGAAGEYGTSPGGTSYIVYGKENPTNLLLDNLDGTLGFYAYKDGTSYSNQLGFSVTGADINNDGLSDAIMGAPANSVCCSALYGQVFVIFGAYPPTPAPTSAPTPTPTRAPTHQPTAVPTSLPTASPTQVPTFRHTTAPTPAPTVEPTAGPTGSPTLMPTHAPTVEPTARPTASPTLTPTHSPTVEPTFAPPTNPTVAPTFQPTTTLAPTGSPTLMPTHVPTVEPTPAPTASTAGSTSSDNEADNTVAIAGGVVGAAAGLGALTAFYFKYGKQKKSEPLLSDSQTSGGDGPSAPPAMEEGAIYKGNPSYAPPATAVAYPVNNENTDIPIADARYKGGDIVYKAQIKYDNPLLNHPQVFEILTQAKQLGGGKAIHKLIEQGANTNSYREFIADMNAEGIKGAVAKFLANDANMGSTQMVANLPNELPSIGSLAADNLVTGLLSTREVLEYLPVIRYLAQGAIDQLGVDITLPETLDNKALLITTHLLLGYTGAQLLPHESVTKGLIAASLSSGAYATKMLAANYLHEQREEVLSQQSMEPIEGAKHCAATMLAYTVPSFTNCAITKLLLPNVECSTGYDLGISAIVGGTECYALYKANSEDSTTITDTIIPYIADIIALGIASQYMNFNLASPTMVMQSVKQFLGAASVVVATDYMSKVLTASIPAEYKESYLEPTLNDLKEIYTNTVDNFSTAVEDLHNYYVDNSDSFYL